MRIIIISSGFEIGGVTSAMRNLCNELVARGHCVDLLNLPGVSELPEGFDKRVQLINLFGFSKNWNLSIEKFKSIKGIKKIWFLVLGALKKITNRNMLWNRIVFHNFNIKNHYDISVGFRQSAVSYWLAKYKCDSDLAVGFWHTDADFENISQLESCMHYPDKICCVSQAITNQMKNKYPELSNKFTTVYNLFNVPSIKESAGKTYAEYDNNFFNIVTVGRLSTQKKITAIPEICSVLKSKGLAFKWYIIGEGEERTNIEYEISKNKVSDCMFLLGAKTNPYPYIKNADLFVLTSAWESYGMVVTESLILGTPVVAGDYPALHEILDDGSNGIIANNTVEGITEVVERVIVDKTLYKKIKSNAQQFDYSTELAVNQLLSLKENS